jgi:hypothetical protein
MYGIRYGIVDWYRQAREDGVPLGATLGFFLGALVFPQMGPIGGVAGKGVSAMRRVYRTARGRTVFGGILRVGRWALGELAAFALALIPLALPLYVVVFFGSATLPFWGQVIAGLPGTPLLFLVLTLAPLQDERLQQVERGVFESIGLAVSALFALSVAGFFVLSALGVLHYIDDIGGVPTMLAVVGVGLVLGALTLRLTGFAVTLVRLAVALVVVAAVFYYFAKAGLAPGWSNLQALQSRLRWTWSAVTLIVLALILRGLLTVVDLRSKQRFLSQAGTLVASVSALFIGTSLCWALFFNNPTPTHTDSFGGSVTPGTPAPGFTHLGDQELAEMFVPVLHLAENEQWRLSDVNRYVKRASLLHADGTPTKRVLTDEYDLPDTCKKGTAFPCWILTCPKCATEKSLAPRQPLIQGDAYVHVIRRYGKNAEPRVFSLASRFASGLSVILQYWLFYDYDKWTTTSPFGKLTQGHSGDWEQVTVGLTEKTPLFVAYSAHCGGRRYAWEDIEAEAASRTADGWFLGRQTPNEPALHPVVGVATGSHANYAHPESGRAPDWTSCRPNIAGGAVLVLSYAANLRDKTNYSTDVIPHVVIAHPNEPPMSFPGTWGLRDETVLQNIRHQTLAQGSGPDTPARKQMWRCPLEVLFESEGWHGTGHFSCPTRDIN